MPLWTETMVNALGEGSGKWYTLKDKVHSTVALSRAWRRVSRNAGAAGADGMSTGRFTGSF